MYLKISAFFAQYHHHFENTFFFVDGLFHRLIVVYVSRYSFTYHDCSFNVMSELFMALLMNGHFENIPTINTTNFNMTVKKCTRLQFILHGIWNPKPVIVSTCEFDMQINIYMIYITYVWLKYVLGWNLKHRRFRFSQGLCPKRAGCCELLNDTPVCDHYITKVHRLH